MKLRPSWWIGALSVTALVVAAGVWTRTSAKDPTQDLSTAAVVRGDIEDAVSALGFLQPQEFVDVGTQVSGQLKRLRVAVGDSVAKGAVLAEIDTAVLMAKVEAGQATLQSLAAQIDEKQAQLALATRQQQRNTTMFAQDIVSRDALETSQAATRVTAAQVASLKAQRLQTGAALRIDQTNLGYANIHAPMAGTVVALNARQGQTLNASQQAPILMRLARLDTMTVVTQVSEADVVRLKAGTEVYFNTLGQPERRWTGSVRQIMPTPDTVNNVVLYNVLFDVANADRQLMTQMSAQVFFVLAQAKDALLVPVAALGAVRAVHDAKAGDTKTARVRVLKDGRVEERKVVVGVMTRLSAQVVSGLVEGEQVVLGSAAASAPESKRDAKPKDGTRRAAKP